MCIVLDCVTRHRLGAVSPESYAGPMLGAPQVAGKVAGGAPAEVWHPTHRGSIYKIDVVPSPSGRYCGNHIPGQLKKLLIHTRDSTNSGLFLISV